MTGLETAGCWGGRVPSSSWRCSEMGPGVFAVIRNDILGRLMAMKPEVYTGHRLVSIGEDTIRMEKEDGGVVEVKVDHVVLSLGSDPGAM